MSLSKSIKFFGLYSSYKNIVNIADEKQVFKVVRNMYIHFNKCFWNILHKYSCLQWEKSVTCVIFCSKRSIWILLQWILDIDRIWLLALPFCLSIVWTMLLITASCFLCYLQVIHTKRTVIRNSVKWILSYKIDGEFSQLTDDF